FEELIQEKIVPLAGDIGIQNFGLDRSTVDDLCEEIDVIIHGAATTSFYERYDVALASNALGAKYICEFAKKCSNMKLLLHLSTAFVAGTRKGLLLEEALQMGETLRPGYCLDIKAELRLVEKIKTELRVANSGGPDQSLEKTAMKELGLKRSGHLNVSFPLFYKYKLCFRHLLTNLQL
uniref:Fatty acyl-CoA reductase n=1 Tax=Aegilops tauschii subsp. strangulata TaxID=200361 RepID=A0A453QID7_AEGTS